MGCSSSKKDLAGVTVVESTPKAVKDANAIKLPDTTSKVADAPAAAEQPDGIQLPDATSKVADAPATSQEPAVTSDPAANPDTEAQRQAAPAVCEPVVDAIACCVLPTALAESERQRRMREQREQEDADLAERRRNQKIADEAMEEERTRRVSENAKFESDDQLERRKATAMAVQAVEVERLSRVIADGDRQPACTPEEVYKATTKLQAASRGSLVRKKGEPQWEDEQSDGEDKDESEGEQTNPYKQNAPTPATPLTAPFAHHIARTPDDPEKLTEKVPFPPSSVESVPAASEEGTPLTTVRTPLYLSASGSTGRVSSRDSASRDSISRSSSIRNSSAKRLSRMTSAAYPDLLVSPGKSQDELQQTEEAINSAEAERSRRLNDLHAQDAADLIERKTNQKIADEAMEEERARRVSENATFESEEHRERRKTTAMAIEAAEVERVSRVVVNSGARSSLSQITAQDAYEATTMLQAVVRGNVARREQQKTVTSRKSTGVIDWLVKTLSLERCV